MNFTKKLHVKYTAYFIYPKPVSCKNIIFNSSFSTIIIILHIPIEIVYPMTKEHKLKEKKLTPVSPERKYNIFVDTRPTILGTYLLTECHFYRKHPENFKFSKSFRGSNVPFQYI